MTDEQAAIFCIAFAVIAPLVLYGIAVLLTRKKRPQQIDWVAHRHRTIARNGFKSRLGAR